MTHCASPRPLAVRPDAPPADALCDAAQAVAHDPSDGQGGKVLVLRHATREALTSFFDRLGLQQVRYSACADALVVFIPWTAPGTQLGELLRRELPEAALVATRDHPPIIPPPNPRARP